MRDGIVTNNPVFVQFLGMCSVLAVTTSVTNAIGMGLSVTAVLICSNLFISLLRNAIPKQVRIASYIIVISGFVTAVELIIKAFLPDLDKSLGLFIPLIVVNCIILARAEAFASKNKPLPSVIDGLASGIGYTVSVVVLAFVRELLGTGIVFAAADGTGGLRILGDWYSPATIFIMPAGAFLTLGFLCAAFNKARSAAAASAEKKAEAAKKTAAPETAEVAE
ncbi:MAG: electron transport complex subunit E [Ruminococcaceae bacterium]|nr:electron transport complex subunit E [Oscillospiraceae bacterium]